MGKIIEKIYFTIEANDGCPWGKDDGYLTLNAAKKDLKEIIKEEINICKADGVWDGKLGMTYTIVKNIVTSKCICKEDVYIVTK